MRLFRTAVASGTIPVDSRTLFRMSEAITSEACCMIDNSYSSDYLGRLHVLDRLQLIVVFRLAFAHTDLSFDF